MAYYQPKYAERRPKTQAKQIHKSVKLRYGKKPVKTVRFSANSSAQEKLETIHRRITNAKSWNLNQYTLSINNTQFTVQDINVFEQILNKYTSQFTLIVTNVSNPTERTQHKQDTEQKDDTFKIIIHYKNTIRRCTFPLDSSLWTDDLLYALKLEAKQHFEINSKVNNIVLCEDKDGNDPFDEIEDLKTVFDDIPMSKKIERRFKFHLYLHIKHNELLNAEYFDDDKKDDNRYISQCIDDKQQNTIMQIHKNIYKKIFGEIRCYIDKDIKSELFQNCIDCIDCLKESIDSDNTYIMRRKIRFWRNYAYLCLILQSVQRCIELRIAVSNELYSRDGFTDDFEEDFYKKLTKIIENYHLLKEKDDEVQFHNLMISLSEIKVAVPTEMMPIDPLNIDEYDIKQDAAPIILTDAKNRNNDNMVRVYLLSPYPSQRTYVSLPDISSEPCELRAVSPQHNQQLLYLDLFVPWSEYQYDTVIQFKCKTNAGPIIIKPSQRIQRNTNGFYWIAIEDQRSGIRKLWDFFTDLVSITKDMKYQSAQLIIDQLLKEIVDYTSFIKSNGILMALQKQLNTKNINEIYQKHMTNLLRRQEMVYVFKIQTINILTENILDIEALYHIIKTCYIDKRSPFRMRGNHPLKYEIGRKIYEDFIKSVQYKFRKHELQKVSSTDYLLLHSIYHFFKYFEDLTRKNQRQQRYNHNYNQRRASTQLIFDEYHKNNNFFLKDLKWQRMDIIDLLTLDLNISSSFNIKRQFPFECTSLRLVELQNENKYPFFKNILIALSSRNKTESESLFINLFRNSHPQIFGTLNDNFGRWMWLINTIKPDLITSNKQIVNTFQNQLQKQIGRMTFNENKLVHLFNLMTQFPTLFDTVNIGLSLLRNHEIIKITNRRDKDKLHKNIENVLRIILNKKIIDRAIQSELTKFITKLLQNGYSKATALPLIGERFLKSDTLKIIFKTAIKNVISQKHSIPDRLSTLMELAVFYEFRSIHQYFIEVAIDNNDDDIHSWNQQQIHKIQTLITNFAKPQNDNAINLWNRIFQKLIVYPMPLNVEQTYTENDGNNERDKPMLYNDSDSDMYTDNDTDNEREDKKEDDVEEEDDDDDTELMHNLRYCLSMSKWLSFAMDVRYIKSLDTLIEFVLEQLNHLNTRITSKQITIECLQLLQEHDILDIVKYCQYEKDFNGKELVSMIKQLLRWMILSQRFRTFLNKFTRAGDIIETETKTFLQILKDWNDKQYIYIEQRPEWANWLYQNTQKLQFINYIQESHVFLYIWWGNRDKLEGKKMDLNNYLETLYKQSKDEWDNLVKRSSTLHLTFEDKRYFQDVELNQELQIMQLKQQTVEKIQRDMADSLKLDKYVEFVQCLVDIVQIFIEYGHTKITKPNDAKWKQLEENFNTAKLKKNDKTQSISAAAKLYRNIKNTIDHKYSDITKQWIKTVVKCKETVNKLANEEEYNIHRFTDTLKIIDDFSTDGQMVQLSGSLRSIYQQFTDIWQQSFRTKIHLMQYFALIKLKRNDINNVLDVHANESKIKQIVSDAGKMAQQRDMEKLDMAMNNGHFKFETNMIATNIATNCFKLCFMVDDKQHRMSCDDIQSKIDIVLLCRRNTNMDEDEEKKDVLDDDTPDGKENVNEYIRKFAICKEISELRVQYVINGGRIHKKLINERLYANGSFDDFNDKQNEWRKRLLDWNDHVSQLRNNSHLLCYFTINKIRVIIEQLNQYKKDKRNKQQQQQAIEQQEKKYDNDEEEQWQCLTCTLLNNMTSARCNACNEPNPSPIRIKRATTDSTEPHLFQQLLSHFRYINQQLQPNKFKKLLKKWRIVDANSRDALHYFDQYFDNDIILTIYPSIKDDKWRNDNFNVIANGQPNLMIAESEKDAIFATLKLYQNMKRVSIPSNQILICDKSTTLEHIQIFIFRCLQNEIRFEYIDSSSAPLFCLLFPEHLMFSVMDKAVEIMDKYLLSRNQATNRYSFVVISCKEKGNPICDVLAQYKTNDISSTFTDDDAKNICNMMFNGDDDHEILQENKLFVQLYDSVQVGMGKTFVIQEKAALINNNETDSLIRIPVNSSDIDLNFIINRLYRCYDGKERNKIIYHIDISSSASDSINILLFNLLFLKYIATTQHECFSVSYNMAFLIELPTKLASLKNKDHEISDEFYLLHPPIQFARRYINMDFNPFQYNDHCHFAVKFLQHFYADELKANDPDPSYQRVDVDEIRQIMTTNFSNSINASPIHQRSIMEYLFTQFQQVVHSTQLKNEWRKDQGQGFNQWKHLVTDSIIDLAEDFSKKLYNDEQKYRDNDDESTGKESFHLTQKWQNQDKPIVLLNQSADGSISFLVSDTNKMDQNLKDTSKLLMFEILDWKQQDKIQSKQEKIKLLLTILGTYSDELLLQLCTVKPYSDYALTFDNMLKMVAIFFRIKANIPVILMGETGCGKTALLNYLAKAANKDIERADVHGGFTYKHIKDKMMDWISIAKKKKEDCDYLLQLKLIQLCSDMEENEYKQQYMHEIQKQHEMQKADDLYIFFDEINTSPDIGYFKEILCDGYFDGEPLPTNMKVIAACNPYRKRTNVKRKYIISDPLSQYMYRVYPLPSTMKEYVWMFGSLSKNDEKAYTYQMCQTATDTILNRNQAQQTKLSQSIVISQEFVRKILKDSAFVSLRDIARCLKIFVYAYNRTHNFDESLIEALALVYYFRLSNSDRYLYNKTLSNNNIRRFFSTLEGEHGVIDKICLLFKDVIPRGIALNRSLRENLFLLFICIQTKTPLILVGKPGSSKTLAMSIIKNYMADKAGKDAQRLKDNHLKPIHVISFQCSTQSKAEGIRERWNQTQKFAEENKDIISVLLLDEIGLAEHSNHRPLKVLHQLLEIEPAPIAFVGLSNWSLDAAKMNRVCMHLCPKHSIEDLKQTATAMAEQYMNNINKIKTKLKVLSYIYKDITVRNNKIQPRRDFFGARDFYAVVKHFLTGRNDRMQRNDDKELIMYFLRDFGGVNFEHDGYDSMRKELFKIIEKHMPLKNKSVLSDTVNEYRPVRLIELNLNDRRSTHNFDDAMVVDNFIISRHIMVINEYMNSWNVLLDLNIINHDNIYIFGSEFERDKTNNIYLHLNRVKQCMETGQTLILCNLDEINESLYDMLNQRYTFIKNSGKMYCRIALGSNSQTCFVDPAFKCIVISPKEDAHRNNGIPIAFLNRFEKQLISYHSSLSPQQLRFLYKLRAEICDLYCLNNMSGIKDIFPGFCGDTFASLILNTVHQENRFVIDEKNDGDDSDDDYVMQENKEEDSDKDDYMETNKYDPMQKCCNTLLNVTLTESLIQTTVNNRDNRRKPLMEYLPSLRLLMYNHTELDKLLILLTFDFESKLNENIETFDDTVFHKMSHFSRSEQFETFLYEFLKNKDNKKMNLLLQYRHNDMNHFIHIKHIIESKMHDLNKYNKRIVLLVHLHRNENLYKEFPLIFSKKTKIAFLDSVSQKHPIRLDSFTNHSIQDVCKERGIHLLQNTFQRALSHLVFNKKIDLKHEIERLSDLLQDKDKESPIQQLIFDRFLRLLSHNKINRNIGDVVCKSISNNKSWQRGSFYERLHDIIDTVGVVAMIRILQTLYTNFNIHILQNNDQKEIVNLFVLLYSQFDLIEDKVLQINVENILEDRPNKLFVKNNYIARFPFSNTIHSWCNSIKSRIIGTADIDIEEEKDDIKREYDEYSDGDSDDNDIEMEWDQEQIDPADRLKQEMESIWPSCICNVSMNASMLYAHDLILLNGHKLQINESFSSELIDLSSKLLIIAALHFSDTVNDDKISIAALETVLWSKHEFVKHLFCILKVLKPHQLTNIYNIIHIDSDTMVNAVDTLLDNILNSLDNNIYKQFNMHSIPDSIHYIIHELSTTNDINHDQYVDALHAKFNMIKIKMISLKCDLLEIDDIELYGVVNGKASLMDYDILSGSFNLLTHFIKDDESKEKMCNQILYELLTLLNDQSIDQSDEEQILEYARFLMDVLCKLDVVIDIDDADSIKWSKETEDEIVRRLFAVLSRDALQTKTIIEEIQHQNKELAGMIVQVMSRKDNHQNAVHGKVEYKKLQKDFDKKLNIITPLIKQFNAEIYEQCMEAVAVETFFTFYHFKKRQYPILFKLKQQHPTFWALDKLPEIAHWIQLIQSKYIGAISVSGCDKLKMNDVFEHCKLNKWGDVKEWKEQFKTYKKAMNSISLNNVLPDTDHNISISASLIAKNVNETIKNNLQNIERMIKLQNKFLETHFTQNCNLFDLTQDQLINTPKVLDIIVSNCKPWICYDAKNTLPPKAYLTFNIKRIENEILSQCINGRSRLNIKYRYFECLGSKNMLRLIQSIGVNQEILNYELWHSFDKQFESNIQRKKALNTIEDVLRLISNAKLEDDDYDDDEDGKDDEKDIDDNNKVAIHNQDQELCSFMQHSLRFDVAKCQIFKVVNGNKSIQLKHIQSLWHELVKRIDGELTQYQDQCYICFESVQILTPIQLECCPLNLHYECLKEYVKARFGKKGNRITLQQLSCFMCKKPMLHKAANELFKETQILYNKVEQVALDQLRTDNKMNDPAVINRGGEFYNKPAAYAMKLYAFWLCYQCEKPYFYGENQCGNDAANNVREEQFLCIPCDEIRMEKLRREERARMERLREQNQQQYDQWLANAGAKACPGNCGRMIQKNGGCNWIRCPCGTELCWQTGLRAGRGAGQCGGGHACHY